MIEIEINEENLKKFTKDIRKEDKEELAFHFGEKFEKKFIKIAKNTKNTYFVADKNKNPLAIGGFEKFKNSNTFQVWLLCTDKLKNNKKELFKYIKTRLKPYKEKSFVLFNYIYKSNFKSLDFIKNLGFEVVDLKNENFKLFYYMKGKNFDIRYITN